MVTDPRDNAGIFYGWYVAAASGLVAFIAWGIGFYQLGVFLNAFQEEYRWSLSALSLSATIFCLVTGTAGLLMGPLVDRHGPRLVLAAGGLVLALGMLGLGQVQVLWHVYLAIALLAVGFTCTSTLVIGAVISRWFVRRRSFVLTLALMGAPLGALLLVPFSTALLSRYGIATSSVLLAGVTLAVLLPVTIGVIRDDPAQSGWHVDGGAHQPNHHADAETARDWTLKQTLRTTVWWAITLAFACIMFGQVAFLVHQINVLRPVIGISNAALLVSITGAFGLLSRLLGGLGDRFPKHHLLAGYCGIQSIAFLLTAHTTHIVTLALASAIVGLAMGNVVALQPLLLAERFGLRSYGLVFGASLFLTQFGSAMGIFLVGFLADINDDYTISFTLSGALALMASLLAVAAGRLALPHPESSPLAKLEAA